VNHPEASAYTGVLAPIYERLGMASFAAGIVPQIIPYLQGDLDWFGRRILDLGCGTGAAARWLATHTMNVTAIDQSPEMLLQARQSIDTSGLSLSWAAGDLRHQQGDTEYDLALALDVMNELGGLREFEAALASVRAALAPGKFFVFDLHTIGGLDRQIGIRIPINADDCFITLEQRFDHERSLLTSEYYVFFNNPNGSWRLERGIRYQRAYPVQAIAALLGRSGYQLMALVTPTFQPVDPAALTADRVLFFARKSDG
jgi:SAM-dependent methyltransferase